MGWSSLVGFAVLVVAVPINYKLGKRALAVRIFLRSEDPLSAEHLFYRSVARDQKPGIAAKLLCKSSSQVRARFAARTTQLSLFSTTAIRTIKFFGWSQAWTAKVEEKRAEELIWMVRGAFVISASLNEPLANTFSLFSRMVEQLRPDGALGHDFSRRPSRLVLLLRQTAGRGPHHRRGVYVPITFLHVPSLIRPGARQWSLTSPLAQGSRTSESDP
jgi:hypothetical protein